MPKQKSEKKRNYDEDGRYLDRTFNNKEAKQCQHLRLEKYRRYLDGKGRKEKIIGAVGGGVIRENVKQFAMKNGLFVIIQTGDSINVLPPEGRKAKEW